MYSPEPHVVPDSWALPLLPVSPEALVPSSPPPPTPNRKRKADADVRVQQPRRGRRRCLAQEIEDHLASLWADEGPSLFLEVTQPGLFDFLHECMPQTLQDHHLFFFKIPKGHSLTQISQQVYPNYGGGTRNKKDRNRFSAVKVTLHQYPTLGPDQVPQGLALFELVITDMVDSNDRFFVFVTDPAYKPSKHRSRDAKKEPRLSSSPNFETSNPWDRFLPLSTFSTM